MLLREDPDTYRGGAQTSHYLSEILASCLDETEFPEETADVIDSYVEGLISHGNVYDLEDGVNTLVERATFRFLDSLLLNPNIGDTDRHWVFIETNYKKNPLSGVSSEKLLTWCRQGDFQERLGMILEAIYPFEAKRDGDETVLSQQALTIIEASENLSRALEILSSSVWPNSWSGSRADIIADRRQALEILLNHDRPDIRVAAETQIAEIKDLENQERRHEQGRDQQSQQRFE